MAMNMHTTVGRVMWKQFYVCNETQLNKFKFTSQSTAKLYKESHEDPKWEKHEWQLHGSKSHKKEKYGHE
jgi:hypothetical protein